MTGRGTGMRGPRERVLRFGREGRLVGVLTEPDPAPAGVPTPGADSAVVATAPDVILLNSEHFHRTGTGRIHVRLARELACAGFASLRFDFSGTGDSEPWQGDASNPRSRLAEVGQAIEVLGAIRGSRRFVVTGHGSGAVTAFRAAVSEPRVTGLVQLDAPAYRTWRHRFNYWARRLLDLGERAEAMPDEVGARLPPTGFPPRHEIARGLTRLLGRGTELFYFFSGSRPEDFNYGTQYEEAFPDIDFGTRLRVEYLEAADFHVTTLEHQEYLVTAIRDWMTEKFSGAESRE